MFCKRQIVRPCRVKNVRPWLGDIYMRKEVKLVYRKSHSIPDVEDFGTHMSQSVHVLRPPPLNVVLGQISTKNNVYDGFIKLLKQKSTPRKF